MNLLTKFHEDQTINEPLEKNAPPPGGYVFQATGTIFKHVPDIIGTNLLTKFHDDQTNVAARVLTRKNARPPPWRPYIIGTNLLTKFHKDRTINVASRVLIRKNDPPPDIIGPNFQTKLLTRKNAPTPDGFVFQPTSIIFKLLQDIIAMNLLTKVLTKKNAPPVGSHVFKANVTIFELIQYIIETNLLTIFHDDWTINVASLVLTGQMLMPHDEQQTKCDHNSSP
ncbi:hypothetical protein DPMN_015640 [Dreissena polymorpha]|uniref:Uncharacterized protein n=1 Tax=Dreissena polymorpha TaxID=45954 RepID=A0A9D4NBX1_DREPO|nr:hypothetical protein DPMN_015640 [Dreissena polymorpha]